MELELAALEMGDKLGDGASGDVFAATLEGQAVAVKVRRRRDNRNSGHGTQHSAVSGFTAVRHAAAHAVTNHCVMRPLTAVSTCTAYVHADIQVGREP